MRSVTAIILFAFIIAWANAKEQAAHLAGDAHDSVDNLMDNMLDNMVNKLFSRVFEALALHHADMERTVLGKPGHAALQNSQLSPLSASASVSSRFPSSLTVPLRQQFRPTPNIVAAAAAEKEAVEPSRRALLTSSLGLAGAVLPGTPASAESFSDSKMVGAFLPESKIAPGFYEVLAGPRRTPAIRAGVLQQYSFALPGTWKEQLVSNARSGNYCQPRCDEATTEVLFSDPKEGSLQVIIIPTTKLNIQKNNPTIEEIGTVPKVLNAIGPALTGSVAVEADEVQDSSTQSVDGKSYYLYTLETPDAIYGLHSVSSVSTNKNYVVIATVAADEKQWGTAKDKLKEVVKSFRVGITSSEGIG